MRTGLQSSTMHSDRYWNVSLNSGKIISYSAVTARLFCLTSEPMECICFASREASANVWKGDSWQKNNLEDQSNRSKQLDVSLKIRDQNQVWPRTHNSYVLTHASFGRQHSIVEFSLKPTASWTQRKFRGEMSSCVVHGVSLTTFVLLITSTLWTLDTTQAAGRATYILTIMPL